MDRIATDSERVERSNLYGRAYDVARAHVDRLSVGLDCGDPASVMRRLVAIVGRELDDDGRARQVIGWAAEDAVAGWGPRVTIRFEPRGRPQINADPRTHDGTLGRLGELRGRPEDAEIVGTPAGQDVLILDARSDESPRQSVERRFDLLRGSMSARVPGKGRGRAVPSSNLRIKEVDPVAVRAN